MAADILQVPLTSRVTRSLMLRRKKNLTVYEGTGVGKQPFTQSHGLARMYTLVA